MRPGRVLLRLDYWNIVAIFEADIEGLCNRGKHMRHASP